LLDAHDEAPAQYRGVALKAFCRRIAASGGGLDQLDQLRRSHYDWIVPKVLNLYEAKSQLSALVEEAAAGKEIIIAKAGVPRARLVPLKPRVRRRPGGSKGKIWIAPDFDAPLPDDIQAAFEGRGHDPEDDKG
jgi:prevent-host-death family protein